MSASGLFADKKGDGNDAIVFLHGFGDNHMVWESIRHAFAGEATTFAFDLPGHGRSLRHPSAGGMRQMADALTGRLAEAGLKRVHLVGHSMGGALAALMALEGGRAAASLTMLAPGGFGTEINRRLLERYAAARDAGDIRIALEEMYGRNNPVTDAAVARHVAMRAIDGQTDKLTEIAAGLARDGGQRVIPRELMVSLKAPVKVLWGTRDRVLPVRQARGLPPMFAAHIFEDTGHMLPAEIPDAVIALIGQNIRAAG